MKARVILIGGFQRTKSLAKSLIKKGYEVTAINKDEKKCQILSEIEKLDVYMGDGSKPFVLEDASVQDADIAIALTDSDEDNLVICQLCKKKFDIKKTVAVVSDPKKTEFFNKMGIDSVVCAISAIANIIEQQAILDEMGTLIPIGEGRINIAQIQISSSSPVLDKKISEINLPKEVNISCILRGEKTMIPRGDTRLMSGDILIMISSIENEVAAIKKLTGR